MHCCLVRRQFQLAASSSGVSRITSASFGLQLSTPGTVLGSDQATPSPGSGTARQRHRVLQRPEPLQLLASRHPGRALSVPPHQGALRISLRRPRQSSSAPCLQSGCWGHSRQAQGPDGPSQPNANQTISGGPPPSGSVEPGLVHPVDLGRPGPLFRLAPPVPERPRWPAGPPDRFEGHLRGRAPT